MVRCNRSGYRPARTFVYLLQKGLNDKVAKLNIKTTVKHQPSDLPALSRSVLPLGHSVTVQEASGLQERCPPLPRTAEEQAGHCTCLHSAWSSLSFSRSIQITLVSMLKTLLRVIDIRYCAAKSSRVHLSGLQERGLPLVATARRKNDGIAPFLHVVRFSTSPLKLKPLIQVSRLEAFSSLQ